MSRLPPSTDVPSFSQLKDQPMEDRLPPLLSRTERLDSKQAISPQEAGPDRIVLTGFMAAGKTTSGRLLAEKLGWRFLDVDLEIEAAEGRSVAEIFRLFGEAAFRELEYQAIRSLASQPRIVLALGGGAIEDERTRRLLLESPGTRLIYLQASFETVLTRCGSTDAVRPVLADRTNLRARYQHRLPLYQQSHQIVAVDELEPAQVVDAILRVKS